MMYGWLWRHLPGNMATRTVVAALLLAAVVAACFLWVFPAIAPFLPFSGPTVGE
jgi:hypothetical protein